MRKIMLALATVAVLAMGGFVGTAQADHGWYGGYGYGGYGYDCYPGYRSSYYYRPNYYGGHRHHHHGHHHQGHYNGGGIHVHGRGYGIHLGF